MPNGSSSAAPSMSASIAPRPAGARKGLQRVRQGPLRRRPMTIWWAVGAAVRRPLDPPHPGRPDGRRRRDRLRVRRHAPWSARAPSNGRTTWGGRASPAVHRCSGSRCWSASGPGCSGPGGWGRPRPGRASALARPPGGPPPGALVPVLLVCDAGYVRDELIRTLLGRGCSFLIRLSSQAQLSSDAGVEVATFREGQFWYGTDTAEKADKPPCASGSSGWRAGSGPTTSGW